MSTISQLPETASNVDAVRWAFAVLNTHDVAPLRQFWDADTVERFPNATCRGADEVAAYFEATFAAMPDFRIDIASVIGEGDDVFVQWSAAGTHTGAPFAGIEASGRQISLSGVDHFVIRDGRVVSNDVFFDQLAYARQVGFLPEDGAPADRLAKSAFKARVRLAQRLRRSSP